MRIVAQQPKFMVRIKQRQPAPAATKPRPLIQAGALPRSATPFEVVAHQVENRIRLRAFEEHGTDDARMDEPGDIESASTSKKSIEKTSDTPFLDLFYGRKFKLPVEAIPGVDDARSNKKRVSYTNSGTAKGNQLVRMDYYLFRLFLRAITPYEFSIPDLYFDNKESAGGVPLIQIFNQSAVKDNWRNLKVVKTTRGFSVDLPIVTVEQDLLLANLATLLNYSSPSRTEGYIETEISDATGAVTIDTENEYSFRVAQLPRDDAKGFPRIELDYLAKADATVIVRNHEGVAISAVLRINCSRKESEYLLRQSFSEARPVDMLNLLLGSVQPKKTNNQHTTYNSATVPSCGFSLAKIARSLPEDSDSMRRTNDDDIVVDAAGDFFFLPKKLNNVPYYDETWLNVVDPESTGTTAYAGGPDVGRSAEAGVQKKISNIGSIPVLIDWQNLKFAYTNTNGALNVLDLDQVYTARAMHYSRFLREPVQGPLGGRLLNEIVDYLNIVGIDARNLGFPMERDYLNVVANSLGYIAQEDRARLPILAIPYTAKTYYEPDTSAEFESRNGIYDPLDVSRKALQGQAQEQEYGPVEANKAPIPGSVGIMAAARALLEKLTNEPERFYRERAVTSVYSLRARLTVLIKGENLDELFERSRIEQAKYIAQKIDDNWEVEPLPLVTTENGGIKPQFHQKNCLNLTKENPDLAIYPASAGAGKCLDYNHIVTTSRGLLSIGEIYESSGDRIGNTGFRELSGTKVVTSRGMLPADKSYSTTGKTVRVNFSDGSYIEGLPEHRMWATTDGLRFDYVRLDALTPAHSLEKRIGLGVFGKQVKLPKLAVFSTDSAAFTRSASNIRIPVQINESLASLLGYIVSEGSVKNYDDRDIVTVTNTDQEVISRIESSAAELFGDAAYTRVTHAPRRSGYLPITEIRFKSSAARFLAQLVGTGHSADRQIPACIRMAPRNIQIAFLRSLFEGDGSVYLKRGGKNDKGYANSWIVDYTTISNTLIIQLKAVLENLGVHCTVRHRRPYKAAQGATSNTSIKQAHTLVINYRHFAAFKQVGFDCSKKSALFHTACIEAEQAAANPINKNTHSQGAFNRFFFSGARAIISQVAKTIIESSEFSRKVVRSGLTTIQYTQALFDELGLSNDSYRGFVHEEYTDKLSRHAVDQIHKFIAPNLHLVSARLRGSYAKLREAFTKYWIQPVSSQRSTKAKRVYDISVPGPHDYVVDSMLSHNTILAILDVLRQIDRGETGPFIIACPASLVPDYVSEIAYVTAGKLNPIAITTDVWDTHARNIKGSLRSIVKSAPINTVLVVSYRTLILGSYDVCYGQETITVYPVIQFLRSFRPTYAFFDECHTLRNKTSKVHKGAMRLMAGCRKKRLASGTMVANTLQDLVGQISLIDPTLFGSEEEFKEKYMEVVEGTKGKKRKPRPGAETAVKNLLFSNMVIAAADRKQWAYKLPKQKRSFLAVQLTPLQQVTHDFILQTVFSAIAPKSPDEEEGFVKTTPDEDASTKSQDRLAASISRGRERAADLIAKGAKLFNSDASIPEDLVDKEGNISLKGLFALARANQGKNTAVEPDDDDIGGDDDEDSGAKKEDDFINYLSVVETFISGPGDYEALMAFVSGKYNVPFLEIDLVSPKVGACISRIREHLQNTPQGKFIVFCNYNATREAIIRALPDDIKKITINYMAEQKLTQRKEFTDNDEIRGLIGIEKSLSTGFNLQVGTRLIRVETVWTPADIEQGNSRINRPSVKKGEVRDRIYYDTIIADDSLDVAKVASLVSKQVAQIKFDQTEAVSLDDTSSTVKQTENPFFALETPDPFNLSPQGILDNCNVQEMNAKYLVPLENISKMLERTYAQFALDNKHKLFANPEIIQPADKPEDTVFPKELIKKEDVLKEKAPPAGSFVMYRIPYTLGMELYKADALGLVPYKKWLEEMGFSKFRESLGLTSSYRPEADVKFGTPAYAAGLKEHTAKLIEAEKNFALKHKPRIHTDLGDGILEGVYGTGIKIRLAATGYLQSVQRNKAFVITRTYTNVQDIRQALISNSKLPIKDANMRDMTPVPLEKLIQEEQSGRTKVRPTAPVQRPAAPVVPKPPVEVVDENAIPVSVVSINGYPSIQVDAELFKIAEKKFVPAHPYGAKMNNKFGYAPASRTLYLIKPRDGSDLAKVIALLEKNGFVIPPIIRTRLLDLRDHVAGGQGLIKKLEHMKLPALTADYITFLARQNNMKTEDGRDKLAIFPYIVDGNNFQFMLTKSAATEKAIALIRESSLAARVTIASRSQTKAAKIFNTADEAEEDLLALFEGKMIDKGTYESQLKKLAALQTVTPAEKLGPYKPLLPEYATAEENKKPAKPPAEKPADVAPQKPTAPVQPAVTKPQAPQPAGKIDAEGEIISYSSFYGVEIKAETPEQVAALTELGFHKSSLRYVVVRTLQQFREVARACSSNGYALPPENRAALMRVNKLWSSHPNPDDLLDFSSKRHTELQVDMEMKFNLGHPKKDHEGNNYPPNTKFVFAIPIVTDTEVRLAVPNAHQDSVDALVSVIKPITNTPIRFDNKNKYILLCEDVQELLATLKELDTVFNLVNRSDMIKQYREIKSSAN